MDDPISHRGSGSDLDAAAIRDGFQTANRGGRELSKTLVATRGEIDKTALAGRQFARALTTAFEGVAFRGKGLGDVLRTLTLSLSRLALKAAFKPLEQAVGNIFTQAFSGGFGLAKGGAGPQSMPVPFAKGGVIAAPVGFSLGTGRMGIMGERGAEAILPLSRGPDGRLGVKAQGGGGVNVTFNVQTPDADSFRRSETQVAAMLARAVSQGQRNL